MSNGLSFIDGPDLFGSIPDAETIFDPHAQARLNERKRRDAEEKADLERRANALPSREEMAVLAMDLANSNIMPDTRIKAMQFAAQLLGYMGTGAGKNDGKDKGGSKTMAVPIAATEAEWENATVSHMKALEKMAGRHG